MSATNNTKFIGRIHKLIANTFPLSHKAGVNFKGTYNEPIAIDTSEDVEMTIEENPENEVNNVHETTGELSLMFFKNFTLLQKYLSDPFQVWLS